MSRGGDSGLVPVPCRGGDWLPSGKLGWADLVRALDEGGPVLLQTTATLLGLKAKEPPPGAPSPAEKAPAAVAPQASVVPPPSLGCEPMPQLALWMLSSLEPVVTDEEPEPRTIEVTVLPVWRSRPAPASYAPLNRWEALLPRLRRELAAARPSGGPDVGEIVRRLGRGDSLDYLPRRTRRRWGTAIQIIEDRSRRLTPYWRDQAMVCGRLRRLFARHTVRRGLVDDALDLPPDMRLGTEDDNDWLPPPAGGAVLVLGDLGHLGGRDGRARAFWIDIGRKAARAGCRVLALTPVAPAAYDEEVAAHWTLLSWERRSLPLTAEQLAAQAERLVDLLSNTVRVEPGLLREVRRVLGFTAATESVFWQHSAVTSDSSVAATLDPAQLKRRRAQFEGLSSPLRRAIWDRTRAWRARLPGEVYLQEAALLDGAALSLLPQEERALLADFVDILSAQIRGLGGATAPSGAEEWFLRLMRLASQNELIWHRRSVHRLWAALRDRVGVTDPPCGFGPADIPPDPHAPELTLEIAQAGDVIILQDLGARAAGTASPIGRITTRNHWVIVEAEASRDFFWESSQPPPWATDWGWDDYGAWVQYSVEGKKGERVSQRMRWIEPGSFLMGSPEDEPERYSDEDPRHEVRIAEGFWLFDTACTQALWEAVMGEHPSRFKGTQRPVEQVSWEDAQRFIAALNERVPGLQLCLPSETQWEYACRAGTETPFSFGGNVTPEQVNYHGGYPYPGGSKGKYRGETVPVGSLPPNPWGLYEMHGNVWEWVQDMWNDNYQGAPSDGSAWESTNPGAVRVVRGGSWGTLARRCRSAFRSGREPGGRYYDLGFRCARAQGHEPGQAMSGASGPGPARGADQAGRRRGRLAERTGWPGAQLGGCGRDAGTGCQGWPPRAGLGNDRRPHPAASGHRRAGDGAAAGRPGHRAALRPRASDPAADPEAQVGQRHGPRPLRVVGGDHGRAEPRWARRSAPALDPAGAIFDGFSPRRAGALAGRRTAASGKHRIRILAVRHPLHPSPVGGADGQESKRVSVTRPPGRASKLEGCAGLPPSTE
jgi:formylglycine-generating enzyme required for sulfatase activity